MKLVELGETFRTMLGLCSYPMYVSLRVSSYQDNDGNGNYQDWKEAVPEVIELSATLEEAVGIVRSDAHDPQLTPAPTDGTDLYSSGGWSARNQGSCWDCSYVIREVSGVDDFFEYVFPYLPYAEF